MYLAMLRRLQAKEPKQAVSYVAMSIRRVLRDNRDFAFSFEELKQELKLEDQDDSLLRAAIGYLLQYDYIGLKESTNGDFSRVRFEFKR